LLLLVTKNNLPPVVTPIMIIEDYIDLLIKKAIPFALLRPPGLSPQLLIQEQPLLKRASSSEDGFYFVPFSSKERSQAFSIRADHVIDLSGDVIFPDLPDYAHTLPNHIEPKEEKVVDKDAYLAMIQNGVQLIREGAVHKIVLSRIIEKEVASLNGWSVFENLSKKYATACIYLVNIPGDSIWFGASPEQLVDFTGAQYQTIALAGTLPSEKDLKWGQKEIEEHAVVADFIQNRLEKMGVDFQKKEVYTRDLGAISHLAQDFFFQVDSKEQLDQLVQELHPGPAISGYPKEKAIQYIYDLEPHDREFYTGYFGYRFGSLNSSWINIRCAKYSNHYLYVYVGGGIMKDSNPEKEWIETEMKSQAVLDTMGE
jgi:isochorismate synthase